MPREINGYFVFDMGEKAPDHPAILALQGISLGDVRMPYGFELMEENGKKYVVPLTQEQWEHILKAVNPDFDHHTMPNFCRFVDNENCSTLGCTTSGYECRKLTGNGRYVCGCV
ncbi:hypothetical protein [Rhizobium leguminosarum]|uniref:hypothetical protein n=1 Tax=Rhizobium leguminosarum TaxID=384 RepID=UPI003F98885A